MNKRTVALTTDQYKSIISTIKKGFLNHRPNERIATALMLEANLGLRISDILKLRLSDIKGVHSEPPRAVIRIAERDGIKATGTGEEHLNVGKCKQAPLLLLSAEPKM